MKKRTITGDFTLQSGETFPGKLKIQGHKSVLTVYCGSIRPNNIGNQTIHGTSHTGEKITLIDCISHGPTIRFAQLQSVTLEFYSSYILLGQGQIFPDSTRITRARFRTRDMASVFYDLRDFHYNRITKDTAEALIEENAIRNVNIGDHPQICYFSGKYVIFEIDTIIGRIWAENSPSTTLGGFKGLQIRNKVYINIEFETGLLLNDALMAIQDLACLMSVIAGRTQKTRSVKLYLNETEELSLVTTIEQVQEEDGGYIHRGDLPLDAIRRPDEFFRVIQQWLIRHKEWHIPRYRWAACQVKASLYDIDRIVAAANMLDILPEGATPKLNTLTPELMAAKENCRGIFYKLPDSPERSSVLGALGRLSKPSLPQKCKHRVSIIQDAMPTPLPDLAFVASIAVKVRNYFVHGSSFPNVDRTLDFMPFLTDTLEFVFLASDLIECGWQMWDWETNDLGYGHSMSRYMRGYPDNLRELRHVHPDVKL
ncbi:HEPN domain-containing protein [Pseudomonas sp. Marseille-Q5115]|uniref:ApeA N-terminal domain 1-containing protein n=1 Tax=Pseudomonas sp. Marseille-Q5115 TaxID=2866593 RepID=UPI001CE4763B|nr:HEPN domain-containing protein [Pseudomonas sp. Marseille-Q5115]